MQINNSTNFSLINSQAINRNKACNEPISKFSIEEAVETSKNVSNENSEKLKYIGLITVYEDDKVQIQIANKDKTNMSFEELDALGWLRQVTIFDKTTKSYTIIDNVEMVENFYNTFANFLNRNDLNIGDFIKYACSKLHSELFELFLDEMGWKVSYQKLENESDINKEIRLVNHDRKNSIDVQELFRFMR